MPHFYVKPENINNGVFSIENEQAHYILTVRRFKKGDEIMIFDGLGNSYRGVISCADKNFIEGKILSSSYKMPSFTIKLYAAVPKGERFEWLIEKCAESGVSEIIPLKTARSVNAFFSENKAGRFEKISVSASSQCGRNDIMKISSPVDFQTACENCFKNKNALNIIPWESEDTVSFFDLDYKNVQAANIFIGPEGGFENQEVELAKSLGFITVTLGENILRTETAAVAASILVAAFQKLKSNA
ncbi:MAG: 16S rRNA (uracil(1498)-N(3))-methyltransferase [Endomicrobium sp.]|jgi:16S rRNA (uracil1498-N3)-methyltransferase|nr:16S rRNA (uracil(1498)-N(3))-methyltransferase [Endomicrobium sp.]